MKILLRKSFFILVCFSTMLFAQNVDWYNASGTKFEISTAEQLKGLAQLVNDGTSHFSGKTIVLIEDITLTEDFIPIGKDSSYKTMFLGTFDGNGHSISGLSVSNARAAGLFGFVYGNGQIKNLTIRATKIKATATSGRAYAGVLAGFYNSQNPIENCYVIADSVVASSTTAMAGGLAGFGGSKISNSYSTANVLATSTGTDSGSLAGGLAGAALAIENSYSTGNVSAINAKSSIAGGLVGEGADITYSGTSISELVRRSRLTISNSYSTGDVSAQSSAGGLVGATIGGTEISKSYSTGNISVNGSSLSIAGGLVGMMTPMGGSINISNSYSTGDVSAISSDNTLDMSLAYSGGLIGYTANASDITNSYARGKVSGKTSSDNFGGIFGRYIGGTLTSVYYNSDATSQPAGQGSPAGIEAKSMDELKMRETFAGWDFDYVWGIEEASTTPFLNQTVSQSSSSSEEQSSSSAELNSSSSNNSTPSSSSDGSVPIFFPHIATANSAIATHNAINLRVQTTACLQIYNLSGELKKTLYFKNGAYNVPLGDLPKGVYMAKITFDNEKKKLKIPVM